MFNSDILEVAIGIVFVFVLISTICSTVREGIEAWLKTRASYLEFGIRELLHDKQGIGLAKDLFNHPLVYGLFGGEYKPGHQGDSPLPWLGGGNLPSYIPARNFALAIMDIAARGPQIQGEAPKVAAPALSLAQIRGNLEKLGNSQVQRVLLTAIDTAQGDFDRARANIEAWYNSSMDRVSGWYKRSTHWILFWIALVISVALNVNSISIVDYLYRHDSERSVIVSTVAQTTADPAAQSRTYDMAQQELREMRLPMGWTNGWGAPRTRSERAKDGRLDSTAKGASTAMPIAVWDDIFGPLIGWLVTAFAATLGAPFWFDVLNKIMVIRSTVKPEEKSGEEGSKDRPLTAPVQLATGGATMPLDLHDGAGANDDCCEIGHLTPTPDDRLPPARGGVSPT